MSISDKVNSPRKSAVPTRVSECVRISRKGGRLPGRRAQVGFLPEKGGAVGWPEVCQECLPRPVLSDPRRPGGRFNRAAGHVPGCLAQPRPCTAV